MPQVPKVYISHAWGGQSEEIVNHLIPALRDAGIQVTLDHQDLGYRESINHFMQELGSADVVIAVISNKYLHSEYCMFELMQIYKAGHFRARLFPIVLDEVNIAKSTERLELVKYWEQQLKQLDSKIRELDSLIHIEGITDDLNLYAEIRHHMAHLTSILKDINALDTHTHQSGNYRNLIDSIQQRLTKLHTPAPKRGPSLVTPKAVPSGEPSKSTNHSWIPWIAGSVVLLMVILISWIIWRPELSGSSPTVSEPKDSINYFLREARQAMMQGNWSDSLHPARKWVNRVLEVNPGNPEAQSIIALLNRSKVLPDSTGQKAEDRPMENKPAITGIKTEDHSIDEDRSPPLNIPAVKPPSSKLVLKQNERDTSREQPAQPLIQKPEPQNQPAEKKRITYTIPKNTDLTLKIQSGVNSDITPSDTRVEFTIDPILLDNRTMNLAEVRAFGKITRTRPSTKNRSGSIDLIIQYIEFEPGVQIPVKLNEFSLVSPSNGPMIIAKNQPFKVRTSIDATITR